MFNPNLLFKVNKDSGINVGNCIRLVEFKTGAVIIPSMQHES
jgi:hypothetical protein